MKTKEKTSELQPRVEFVVLSVADNHEVWRMMMFDQEHYEDHFVSREQSLLDAFKVAYNLNKLEPWWNEDHEKRTQESLQRLEYAWKRRHRFT